MEILIENVRKYPCLYDMSDENYKNIVLKAEIWETIGKELNENASILKTKWKNLRDNYVRHKKQLKGSTGQSTKKNKWPWYSQLKFLDVTLVPRASSSNVSRTLDLTPPHTIVSTVSPTPALSPPVYSQVSTQPTAFTPTFPTSPVLTPRAKRKKRHDPDDVEKIIDYLKTKQKSKFDDVDHLFQSYAETFKKFSEKNKIRLKVELAQLFADTELREIENQFEPVYASTYSVISSDSQNTMSPICSEYRISSAQQDSPTRFIQVVSPTPPESSTNVNFETCQCIHSPHSK